MTYILVATAKDDIALAADYYESQRSGLGSEFVTEVHRGLSVLVESPYRWPFIAEGFSQISN